MPTATCTSHKLHWDRDQYIECPMCARIRRFSSDLQDVGDLAIEFGTEIDDGVRQRTEDNDVEWDRAMTLADQLATVLVELKNKQPAPHVREEPPSRPVMGAWNGKGI